MSVKVVPKRPMVLPLPPEDFEEGVFPYEEEVALEN